MMVHSNLGGPRSPLLVLGVDLENRRTSGENEVLPENLEVDVWSWDQTYGPEPRRTVQTVTKDFILTSHPIALVFLILELFW